jgi:hypothetical protein
LGLVILANYQCSPATKDFIITKDSIKDHEKYTWIDSGVFPFYTNGEISSSPVSIPKGKYRMFFKAYGTKGDSRMPYFTIHIGPYKVSEPFVTETLSPFSIKFELPEHVNGAIRFHYEDDFKSSTEDRNVYLQFPVTIRSY